MIVKISRTTSNIAPSYDIEGENFYYNGHIGPISRLQTIVLSNQENTIRGTYRVSQWVNYIPLRYLFGEANLTRTFNLYKNEEDYGGILFSQHGYMKSFYLIALKNGEIFHCYRRREGSFDYVTIYQGDTQIALIETYLNVNDCQYNHKLYLLNTHKEFADVFSFFVLYYANYHFVARFYISKGSQYTYSRSFSKYDHKYDPKWRETHFPYENFFGKTDLFNS